MGRGRILLAILLLASALLWSEPVATLHPSNYVDDFAHVLSDQTVTELNDICKQLDDKAHAQVAVVTINSLDGSDVDGYALDLYQRWGIGGKATNRGVLILFAIKDHQRRIEVGYGLEPILPDGKVGGFGREAVPLLQQNDYNGAVRLVTLRVADVIASDAGIQLTGGAAQAPTSGRSPSGGISLSGIVLLILLLIIVLATPLRSLLWLLLFSNPGGGYRGGGWGGGGFGGFGGFGGGMSGGGGASGSW